MLDKYSQKVLKINS